MDNLLDNAARFSHPGGEVRCRVDDDEAQCAHRGRGRRHRHPASKELPQYLRPLLPDRAPDRAAAAAAAASACRSSPGWCARCAAREASSQEGRPGHPLRRRLPRWRSGGVTAPSPRRTRAASWSSRTRRRSPRGCCSTSSASSYAVELAARRRARRWRAPRGSLRPDRSSTSACPRSTASRSAAAARRRRLHPHPDPHRPRASRTTWSTASSWGPTTTWSSRSTSPSCWRASRGMLRRRAWAKRGRRAGDDRRPRDDRRDLDEAASGEAPPAATALLAARLRRLLGRLPELTGRRPAPARSSCRARRWR